MKNRGLVKRSSKIFRWIARLWSLLVFIGAMLIAFTPDPTSSGQISVEDWFLLSLWGIAIFGLMVAWRWETIGGLITIVTMFFRELMWIVIKGNWLVNFLIIWLVVIPPAVLYILARQIDKGHNRVSGLGVGCV